MAETQYMRTCRADGTVWYVPKAMHKPPPNRLQIAGQRYGGISAFTSRSKVEAARLESKREQILDSRRCPNCGATSYSEVKVRR